MDESSQASHPPRGVIAWAGQLVLYGLFAVFIGVFSHWPTYRHLAPDTALVKLSLVHAGEVPLLQAALAAMRANLAQINATQRPPAKMHHG